MLWSTHSWPLQVQKNLHMELTPLEETIVDMAVTLIDVGIAKPERK